MTAEQFLAGYGAADSIYDSVPAGPYARCNEQVAIMKVVVTTESFGRQGSFFPVKISQDIAQDIVSIAAKRQVRMENLVHEIFEQYIARQSWTKKQSGAAFLLSLAGMFDSGTSDTSENVQTIVTDFILKKQKTL